MANRAMRRNDDLKQQLPSFPSIKHLPFEPNAARDDLIASEDEAAAVLAAPQVWVEEKLDGASCGMLWLDGHARIRDRRHILNPAFLRERNGVRRATAAKDQFRPAWTWLHQHKERFRRVNALIGEPAAVYGEWMLARHGITYVLPEHFIAYDVYVPSYRHWLPPGQARDMLERAGFVVAPLLGCGPISNWMSLAELARSRSVWSEDRREGVVVKLPDATRYKMVRPDYEQGALWNPETITRQELIVLGGYLHQPDRVLLPPTI